MAQPPRSPSLGTWGGPPSHVHCVHVSLVVEPLLLLAHQCEIFILRSVSCKDWQKSPVSNYHGRSVMQGLTPQSRIYFSSLWCLLNLPLGCVTVEMIMWCFNVVWSCPLVAQALGPPRKCSTGPPGMRYKVICRWLLLVLGVEVSRWVRLIWM